MGKKEKANSEAGRAFPETQARRKDSENFLGVIAPLGMKEGVSLKRDARK